MENFEEKLKRLEEISEKINEGDISLEKASLIFEEGITLARELEKKLSKMERRIEILVNKPGTENDKPNLELFPDLPGS